ncbi:MAG: hypothetical protein KDB14_21830 [Planctomycetales bacterium]|nr:hypothetical protein [Planctomycetales bacterium]
MGLSPRTRRLRSDLKVLEALQAESTIMSFSAPPMHADAPDSYVITFRGSGLARNAANQIVTIHQHDVFIKLGANYPRGTPELAWRTPIFHPNISAGGAVCLGGYGTHWTPSLMLDELCTMLWDMVRYANFDVESPYNREAAHWARTQTEFRLPLDARPIRDRIACGTANRETRPPMALPVALPSPTPAAAPPQRQAVPDVRREEPEMVFLQEEVVEAEIVRAEVVDREDGPDILFID